MFRCVLALSKPMQKPVIPLVLSVVCEGTEAARRFFFALVPRVRRAAQWRDLLFHRVLATNCSTYRNLSSRPKHPARSLRGLRSGGTCFVFDHHVLALNQATTKNLSSRPKQPGAFPGCAVEGPAFSP